MPRLIELRDVTFTYAMRAGTPVTAIQDLSLNIEDGELIAVIGANGSGKSTLGKLLNALLIPDLGEVRVLGLSTRDRANHARIRALIGMAFQRPQDQVVAITVAEDVAFGPGNLGLPPAEIRQRVAAALDAVGLQGFESRPSYLLSAGETQRLALAGVLAVQPRCVILDETTAMLDPLGREMVVRQAKALQRQGMTVIMITHLMEEAAQADRIIALQAGRLVMDGRPGDIFRSERNLRAIGLDLPPASSLGNALHALIPEIPQGLLLLDLLINAIPEFKGRISEKEDAIPDHFHGNEVIQVEKLDHTYLRETPLAYQSLRGANLTVESGAMHGLIGATGSGKTTLLQHLNALIRPQEGKVLVLGNDLGGIRLNVKALRRDVGLVFQQPENQIFEQYVGDEIAFAARNFNVSGKLSDLVCKAMGAVGLDFDAYKDRFTSTLSGGEQRKVALASVLVGGPRILLLDEPLAGLDPASRAAVTGYLMDLNRVGKTLLVSTHQLEDFAEGMHALSVLSKGRDILHGKPAAVLAREDALEASGIRPPFTLMVINAFRKKGWPLPVDILSSGQLIQALNFDRGRGSA